MMTINDSVKSHQQVHLRPCLLIKAQGKRTAGTGVDFVVERYYS